MNDWNDGVLPHGSLEPLAENLWLVRGSLPRGNLPRAMVVYRLDDGRLLIHSAIALDEAGMAAIDALGVVTFIIVPNAFHRLDAARYKARYPSAQVLTPSFIHDAAAKLVAVDGHCEDVLPGLGIACRTPAGVKDSEFVYELPVDGGVAVVITDLLFNLPVLKGFDGWVFKMIGSSGFFGMTAVGRMLMLNNRGRFKRWLESQAGRTDIRLICVAHGDPIVEDCGPRLQQAADRL